MRIQIRAATPEDVASIARVHVDSWRSTYDGIVPAEYLAGLSYQSRESLWKEALTTDRPGTSYFVAETQGGDTVGFANSGPEREGDITYRGELYAIYLLEAYQHMGLGRRLFSSVTRRLLSDGFNSMLLWVLEDNRPACRFYESLGGERVGRKIVTIGGIDLVEVSYGWRGIFDLIDLRADAGKL
ncbi:MAG: GNAT family N-acetyltransferase [Dehalococcoidia bacterium]|nr:GNAT family N-acetyltransferase [Dehalococcoidia bacterium]